MRRYTYLLDNGHGGIIDGVYQTEGKRSPVWSDGKQLFEGEFNRAVVNRLAEMLHEAGIHYVKVTPQDQDITLYERVLRIKAWASQTHCILVSIHANYSDGKGTGHGLEVFTTVGQTASDKVADVFIKHLKNNFTEARMRTDDADGDFDKEENFYILRKSPCPAILTENFFMDNETECRKYLMTPEGRTDIAFAHFQAILEIEEKGI